MSFSGCPLSPTKTYFGFFPFCFCNNLIASSLSNSDLAFSDFAISLETIATLRVKSILSQVIDSISVRLAPVNKAKEQIVFIQSVLILSISCLACSLVIQRTLIGGSFFFGIYGILSMYPD